VIVGGGHNGLVATSYLARAGKSVLILERNDRLGGAAVSTEIFSGFKAKISEYSYLLSLFPKQIIQELDLRFQTRRRETASFTPFLKNRQHKGLMISNVNPARTEQSFAELPENRDEYKSYKRLRRLEQIFAAKVWPTMLRPIMSRSDMKKKFKNAEEIESWDAFAENPLGQGLERILKDDVVRGLVFTDAKVGVLTHPHDPSLLQNRTFIYHIIGNISGEWQVPVGGMGALTKELEDYARKNGAEIKTSAKVMNIEPGKNKSTVLYYNLKNGVVEYVDAKFILVNAAPKVLKEMLADPYQPEVIEGSVFKINMLLKKLPRLKARDYSSSAAFTGTFRVNESYTNMEQSYHHAARGIIPPNPPGEMYCHTLTDSSILSPELQKADYHTFTFFGLDMPYRLFYLGNENMKKEIKERYLRAINKYLSDPIENCLAIDKDGKPCIEVKSPVDIENELAMPYGNIFHAPLSWPFTENEDEHGSWGVETGYDNIFLCGAGAKRGGCVSGIPGHNAAMKVLESNR